MTAVATPNTQDQPPTRPKRIPAYCFQPVSIEPILPVGAITPEWAYGGSTGAGIKVAVIDSGIDASHPDLKRGVQGYVSVKQNKDTGEFVYSSDMHQDSYGHGTACAGIIRSIAPDCDIYSVKVLGFGLLGSGDVFVAGMRWAIENQMDVCNLSLGTTKTDYFSDLLNLVESAYFKNVMLVTAANNLPAPSAPSIYSSVISVASHDDDDNRFYANPNPPVDFSARGIDVTVPWLDKTSMVMTGNSFAAPHITGLVALIKAKHPNLHPAHVKVILHALASNVAGSSISEAVSPQP